MPLHRQQNESQHAEKSKRPKGMTRIARKTQAKPARMIAYDFETTNIAVGTPAPLYLTAYGDAPAFSYEGKLNGMAHLRDVIINNFLTDELINIKFVAWNANNFDAYFIAAALLLSDDYVLRPYLTKGNALRGLRVIVKADQELPYGSQRAWEFLDGMAMLGLAGVSLEKFLKVFAPDYGKMVGVIDWENGGFNPDDKQHQMYAYRDSVGLYYGMTAAQNILLDVFNQALTVTLGNACIKIFKSHIPEKITVTNLPDAALSIVREYVMRGGYCFIMRRYHGLVWKYDINQAYAAAMREAQLPCGDAYHLSSGGSRYAKTYIARVTASNVKNIIPFYLRINDNGRIKSTFATTVIDDSWLTSTEIKQLKTEGWQVTEHECWYWSDAFSMTDYVNKLEHTRLNCEGGTNGAIGTMVKAVGNHSYGKTVEQLDNTEFLLASACPDGYQPFYGDDDADAIQHVYFRFTDPRDKDYHQPHVGAFITAHVRMVVRRAALLAPHAFLYADTDCVVFSEDVTAKMDIDARRYGAWKIEESGAEYRLIAKKVYQNVATGKGNAKGLNVRRLTPTDFKDWYEGKEPVQEQIQRNNFVKVMSGEEMFKKQIRRGTEIEVN
jgi:uncharacterized protein YneR